MRQNLKRILYQSISLKLQGPKEKYYFEPHSAAYLSGCCYENKLPKIHPFEKFSHNLKRS